LGFIAECYQAPYGSLEVPITTDVESSPGTNYPKRPSHAVALIAVAVAVLFWWLNSPTAVAVVEAEVAPEGGITAIVNSCGGELGVDVYEDDSLVFIEVLDHRFRAGLSNRDCQDVIRIPLSVPLGARMLVDRVTSQSVPMS